MISHSNIEAADHGGCLVTLLRHANRQSCNKHMQQQMLSAKLSGRILKAAREQQQQVEDEEAEEQMAKLSGGRVQVMDCCVCHSEAACVLARMYENAFKEGIPFWPTLSMGSTGMVSKMDFA